MRDNTAKYLSRVHRAFYRGTSGRIGRRFVANDMLLLTTMGRQTGEPHTVPLLYLADDPDVLVIASWGGRDCPPDWYLNLVEGPHLRVQIKGVTHDADAVVLADPDRAKWWPRFVAAYPGYTSYQERTERIIPIIRLVIDQPARSG